MENLVTVATFDFPAEAEVAKLFLEEKGIQAFLADANLVGLNWFLANAVGGAKLQVAAADVDRANDVLELYWASKRKTHDEPPEEPITFACQECGKSITFPAERGGHVEVCPECGSYVDVPQATEKPTPAVAQAQPPQTLDPTAQTTAQLWFEVSAVLCLAYIPWMFYALLPASVDRPRNYSFVCDLLDMFVGAARVSLPLLAILALSRDRWSLFGIVRPKWIIDAILACVICFCGEILHDFVMSLVPQSMFEMSHSLNTARRTMPEGVPEYILLFIAYIAMGFAEELVFRGYLIPRFERLFRSTWLAVLVTTALFASYHVYYGAVWTIGIAAIGLVYAIAFCICRRLWPLCVAHALGNIVICLHLTR